MTKPSQYRALAQCERTASLTTSFKADTVAVGTMFTVQTHDDPISIITMEVSANPVNEDGMDIEIYTKAGNYIGFEKRMSEWDLVTKTVVIPAREGRGTLIPDDAFSDVKMAAGELRSFYVTLKTSDLRYSRSNQNATDEPVSTDGFLSVYPGVGLADYKFNSDRFFDGRFFNGIFHYNHFTDCDEPSAKAYITLKFHVQPHEKTLVKELINQFNIKVAASVRYLLDTSMMALRDTHSLKLVGVDSRMLQQVDSAGADTGCPVHAWAACVTLESHVILAHHETINSGKVHYNMLSHIDDLFTALEREATKLDIVYGGDQPLPPLEIVVALKGVPPNVPMDDLQMTYFEQITTDYLAQQLLSISPFPVLSAKVKSQRGPSFVQRVRRGLQEQDTGDDWIEVTTHVLGSYTPPLDTTVKLDDIVNDAFKYGKDAFIEDVKTGPSRPGSILQGEQGIFFAGVSNANFRLASETVYAKASVNGNSAISMDAGDGNSKLISLCVGLIAVMSMWIGFVVYRMRKADDNSIVSTKSGKDKEKENLDNNYGMKLNEPTKSSKAVDGIKAQTKKKKPTSKVSISPDTFDATSGFHDDALPNDLEVDVLSGSETSSKRIKSGRDIKVSGQNKSTHSSGTVAADDIKNTDLVGVKGNRSRSFKNRGKSDAISEPEQTHSSQKSRPAPVNYQAAFAAVGMAQDPDRESALSSRSKGSNRSGSPKTNESNLGLANERTSNHADLVDDDEKSMNNKESPKQEDKTTVTQSVDKALSKSHSGRSVHNRSSQDSTTATQSVDKALSRSRSMNNRSSQDSTTATQSVDKALSKSHSGRSMHNRSS